MSFSVQLTPDLTPVEPGSTTPVSVVVVNRTDEQDRYELEIEGIDPEWKAVPVPVFAVEANETHTEKVFFKPRRTSESLAGNYPFVVRVRSLVTGEHRTVQGVLQVRPFHHVTMEISPKKGFVSPFRKQNAFEITLVNLGNTEHTLHLVGSDPEDACAYEFEQEQVTVAPGQQRSVEMTVVPLTQRVYSGGRLIGFSVTGRSVDVPSVVSSTQAQLEQRSLLNPTSLFFFVLAALLFGAWLMFMPKPPTIALSVDPLEITRGEPVTVSWRAEHASNVRISHANGDVIYDGPELSGSRSWVPETAGLLTLSAVARKDGRTRAEATRQVNVLEPAPVPAPVILTLSAEPRRVRLGESFILKYRFNESVKRAVLAPTGTELDLAVNELEVTPQRAGPQEFTVVATNAKGEAARRSISISVVDESDARIPVFRADPTKLQAPDTRTTLTWLVTGAVRAEVEVNGRTFTVDYDSSMSFDITAKTTFTLTAYDSKGRTVTRKVTVDYEQEKPPVQDTTGTTSDTATTTGTAGGTGMTTTGTTGTTTTAATTGGRL